MSATAAESAATAALALALENTEMKKIDLSHPTVIIRTIDDAQWKDHDLLDRSKNNYPSWAHQMKCTLTISSGLFCHLLDGISPNETYQPHTFDNWSTNDSMILTYLQSKCEDGESKYIDLCETSKEAWETLKVRHEQHGIGMSMHLMNKAMNYSFNWDRPIHEVIVDIRCTVQQIWENRPITQSSFLTFVLVWSLRSSSSDFSHVTSTIIHELSKNESYNEADIIKCLEHEEELQLSPSNHSSIPAVSEALAAVRDVETCSNCKKVGHNI